MIDENVLPIDAINEFYRLKDSYETEYYKKYISPIIRSKNSKREKRTNFSKLPKNECINCKRNVGTIFSIVNGKTEQSEIIRKYTVKCGDINDPCPLDIEILYGIRERMDVTIRDGMKEIEQIKMNIIKEKNNAIFFNKEVTAIFENISDELKTETENVGLIVETNMLRNNNPEKYALLKKTINDFGTSFIIPFKQQIDKYKETNNTSYLNAAIVFYNDEMIPKLKEIQALKYNVNMVDYNPLTDMYKLIQLPNSLENNEFFFREDDKLVKVNYGINQKQKTSKSPKTQRVKSKSKAKTMKLRPDVETPSSENSESKTSKSVETSPSYAESTEEENELNSEE